MEERSQSNVIDAAANGFLDMIKILTNNETFPILTISMTALVAFISILSYLKPVKSESQNEKNHNIDNLNFELSEIKKSIENIKVEKELNNEEKLSLINNISEKIGEESIKEIFKKESALFAASVRSEANDSLRIGAITDSSNKIISRINNEIYELRKRCAMNLSIGAVATLLAVILLTSATINLTSSDLIGQIISDDSNSNDKFIKILAIQLAPKISLAIFIEVFAYFFLRLYRNGLSEIKYFQNELTNIESKLAAAEISYITNDNESLRLSIDSLAKTERNFVLEKGQTTVELERAKSDSKLNESFISSMFTFLKSKSK